MSETVRRVLVADDEAPIRRVVRLSLERAGYVVEEASNGVAALEALRARPFDVLVTDIEMPQMSGDQLCWTLADDPPPHPLMIFVVTGRSDARLDEIENVERLEKPVSLRHLLARIAARLETQAAPTT
ncbi:MAG: response regulator [Myxococcota bacterium]